jgi:hypothetical protein
MKNETTIALTKVVSGKSKDTKVARACLKPGEYKVDTTVHVVGTMRVAEDNDIAPTVSILNTDFLALVLHHAGITREASAKLIKEIADDYLIDWTGSEEDKKKAKAARKAKVAEIDPEGKIRAIFDDLKASLPRIPAKGKVTWKGTVVEVEAIGEPMEIEVAQAVEKKDVDAA